MTNERCQLTRYMSEMNSLLFRWEARLNEVEFCTAVVDLGRRNKRWLQSLPETLHYSYSVPSGLFDFQ